MAAQKINYQNKVRGDLFTSANANEVKEAVNHNADELDNIGRRVSENSSTMTELSQAVTNLHNDVLTPIISMEETEVSGLQPGKLYTWGSIASLQINSFAAATAGIAVEYMLQFVVGSNNFTVSLPNGILWAEEPSWENGYTYQVSIVNNLAIGAGWEAAAE